MIKSHLFNELLDAEKELEELIERLSEQEKSGPEGTIMVDTINHKPRFYHRTDTSVRRGKRIKKTDTQLISSLAQKKYNSRLKKAALAEIGVLKRTIASLKDNVFSIDDIFNSMNPALQPYISREPHVDEAYIMKWKNQPVWENRRKNNINGLETTGGEKVRSKSELIIAERLRHYKIPYNYEKPLTDEYAGPVHLFPDFTCLNTRTGKTYYWEHCGMFDDPKYSADLMQKIRNYSAYGIELGSELIITMETSRLPLETRYIERLIHRYLL